MTKWFGLFSGVAFIFNQQFFKTMTAQTGIDLENIVYYKDETHYFVMCAKKQSLLEKGVILRVKLFSHFTIFLQIPSAPPSPRCGNFAHVHHRGHGWHIL